MSHSRLVSSVTTRVVIPTPLVVEGDGWWGEELWWRSVLDHYFVEGPRLGLEHDDPAAMLLDLHSGTLHPTPAPVSAPGRTTGAGRRRSRVG